MSRSYLQTIIGTALTDANFRNRLLESPAEIANQYPLNPKERAALLKVRADSLAELAMQLENFLEANGDSKPKRKYQDSHHVQKWVLLG